MRPVLTTPHDTIEDDFAALQRSLSISSVLHHLEVPDACVYWSDGDAAGLNVIADARINHDDVAARVPELLAPFFARGQAFQWITTPYTTTPPLEAALAQAGLSAQQFPAMRAALRTPVDPGTPADVYIDLAWPDQVAPISVTFNNYSQAPEPLEDAVDILDSLDPDTNHCFLARNLTNGQTLGAGTMHTRGDSAMLANIMVLPAGRDRGLERALAATMMNRAASTGATTATLVANATTYPIFIDLGFRTQFDVVTWSWQPNS